MSFGFAPGMPGATSDTMRDFIEFSPLVAVNRPTQREGFAQGLKPQRFVEM
jgi:hypothetical protein